jgi:hypothetical protein
MPTDSPRYEKKGEWFKAMQVYESQDDAPTLSVRLHQLQCLENMQQWLPQITMASSLWKDVC